MYQCANTKQFEVQRSAQKRMENKRLENKTLERIIILYLNAFSLIVLWTGVVKFYSSMTRQNNYGSYLL